MKLSQVVFRYVADRKAVTYEISSQVVSQPWSRRT